MRWLVDECVDVALVADLRNSGHDALYMSDVAPRSPDIEDMQRAPEVAQELSHILTGNLYILDWSKQNRTWFAAVQTEKRMMFIILTLIIADAAFNRVSTLVMTVTDKV